MDVVFLKMFYSDTKGMGIHDNIHCTKNWDLPTTETTKIDAASFQISMKNVGHLKGGHNGSITCIKTVKDNPNLVITGSTDGCITIWSIESSLSSKDERIWGDIECVLKGHSSAVSDLCVSADGEYVLSASMDKTIKLWHIKKQEIVSDFEQHSDGVLGAVLSLDNRRIYSIGKDKKYILWNTIGQVKYEESIDANEWFSCIDISPSADFADQSSMAEVCVTGGNCVKFWDVSGSMGTPVLKGSDKGEHEGKISAICLSPDSSLVASADENGFICLWCVTEMEILTTMQASCGQYEIKDLNFCPTRYWMVIAVEDEIEIFDLESKDSIVRLTRNDGINVTSICWKNDGEVLCGGYEDSTVSIWKVQSPNRQEKSDGYDATDEKEPENVIDAILKKYPRFKSEKLILRIVVGEMNLKRFDPNDPKLNATLVDKIEKIKGVDYNLEMLEW